ncbi:hypothetical protein NDU88_000849 [Pleurodeles waltl]|uniref:Uncharacterized protein n=1 Tax=Pleurodeles waltl TaxID=8319 RepID=A0AAV7URP1_PLEWA|nr:hypothetical protein NDU88_000849 [Pleurodeles waltl]
MKKRDYFRKRGSTREPYRKAWLRFYSQVAILSPERWDIKRGTGEIYVWARFTKVGATKTLHTAAGGAIALGQTKV